MTTERLRQVCKALIKTVIAELNLQCELNPDLKDNPAVADAMKGYFFMEKMLDKNQIGVEDLKNLVPELRRNLMKNWAGVSA